VKKQSFGGRRFWKRIRPLYQMDMAGLRSGESTKRGKQTRVLAKKKGSQEKHRAKIRRSSKGNHERERKWVGGHAWQTQAGYLGKVVSKGNGSPQKRRLEPKRGGKGKSVTDRDPRTHTREEIEDGEASIAVPKIRGGGKERERKNCAKEKPAQSIKLYRTKDRKITSPWRCPERGKRGLGQRKKQLGKTPQENQTCITA